MALQIRQRIANYRIIAELGSGGCGRVYLGRHVFLSDHLVAIKVMNTAHLDSRQKQERFLREARFLHRLKHPHILPILDVGFFEDIPYLITEYAPKGSLKDRLDQHPQHHLPEEEVLTIVSQIGEALQYAHQHAVVHRDLKPENILFTAQDQALLADFSIAMTLSTAGTEPGDVAGTALYMAPEQFQGIVSRKSDQYALGCITYELLTGRKPFAPAGFFSLAVKHLNEQPPPPAHYNSQISTHLDLAILKAMAKQRADRYTDIAAFLAALRCSQHDRRTPPALTYAPVRSLDLVLRQKDGPLDEEQAITWIISLCEELRSCHVQEPPLIFGEITPDDILVTPQGNVRLIKMRSKQKPDQRSQSEETRRYLGEYAYASPEFLRQEHGVHHPDRVDACSDIYSLGAILYCLLTNYIPEPLRTPLPGSMLVKNRCLRTALIDTGVVCPAEKVIIKAMQQEPRRRFQSANAMRTALQQCLLIEKLGRGTE